MNTIVLFSTPVTFVVPVLVQFPSIPDFYADIPDFYSGIFPLSATIGCCTHSAQSIVGWLGGGARVVKNRLQIRAQNYSGAKIIVPTQGLMTGPSPDPVPVTQYPQIMPDYEIMTGI